MGIEEQKSLVQWYIFNLILTKVSVILIWVLTGFLIGEAVLKFRHPPEVINAKMMLVLSCVGLVVNIMYLRPFKLIQINYNFQYWSSPQEHQC